MRALANIFWLGTKELRSVLSDTIMLVFIVYSFTLSIYTQAKSAGESVNNASIAIVDEDQSELSRKLRNALYPPYFKEPELISAAEADVAMNEGRFMFVVSIPPNFEADVKRERSPAIQLNIDATAVNQASLGASYIQNIMLAEVNRFIDRADTDSVSAVSLVARRAFNPNGTQVWFDAFNGLLNQLSMLTIILTGAALLREREHGTIEHLFVMPITAFQIAIAKVWANGLIILCAFTFSVYFVVEGALDVPIAGSVWLLLAGTTIYLAAAAAIGILLGILAKSMAQFGLLAVLVIMPIMMLSGGMSPVESQPDIIQPITWLLPSRHYMTFAQAVVFRGAGIDIVWPEFITVAGLGIVFLSVSLVLFRRSMNAGA